MTARSTSVPESARFATAARAAERRINNALALPHGGRSFDVASARTLISQIPIPRSRPRLQEIAPAPRTLPLT
jgi:hypothetical protein